MSKDDSDIDIIFRIIDNLLCQGSFKAVDEILRKLDLAQMSIVQTVAYLSITRFDSHKLCDRTDFVHRARLHLMTLAPDRIEGLMQGLE